MDLQRVIFKTSRESEYFTEKELRAQIGHGQEYWPLAVLRELIDNSLDACEMTGIAPEINVTVQDDRLIVSDNGPGIPPEIITKSLDYMVRVSDKAYYVSPTRGQMGNALKVVWAAPYVATAKSQIEVTAQGEKHTIRVALDQIEGKPTIEHVREPFVRNGTSVSIEWGNSSALLLDPKSNDSYKWLDEKEGDCHYFEIPPSAHDLIESFSAFNPHATFSLNGKTYPATDPTWKKWNPNMPTSAHWYKPETLRDLIAAYIAHGRNGGQPKTVRAFVSEFRGLSSTAKQKEVTAAWSGAHLDDFVTEGDVSKEFVTALLGKMQGACVAPKPGVLGMVVKEHLTAWMEAHGVTPSSVKYIYRKGEEDGMPYILETAFGISKNDTKRRLVTGLNWSPVLSGDPDPTIRQGVQDARIDPHDPVMLMIHIARPRFEFMDRGKTRIAL